MNSGFDLNLEQTSGNNEKMTYCYSYRDLRSEWELTCPKSVYYYNSTNKFDDDISIRPGEK